MNALLKCTASYIDEGWSSWHLTDGNSNLGLGTLLQWDYCEDHTNSIAVRPVHTCCPLTLWNMYTKFIHQYYVVCYTIKKTLHVQLKFECYQFICFTFSEAIWAKLTSIKFFGETGTNFVVIEFSFAIWFWQTVGTARGWSCDIEYKWEYLSIVIKLIQIYNHNKHITDAIIFHA